MAAGVQVPGPTGPRDGARLLIVRPSALGDVARTVPVLAALRGSFPNASIDWLVHPAYADAIRCHPDLREAIPFDRKGMSGFGLRPSATRKGLSLIRRLRRERYDRVYDLQGLARSGFFTWMSGSRHRVGFADAREGAAWGYNRRHHVNKVHTVDRMLGLLAADGVALQQEPDLRLYTPAEDQRWADSYLAKHGIDAERGFVCVAPTAQWRCKWWPMDRYAALINRIVAEPCCGGRVLVLAAPHEFDELLPLREALDAQAAGRVDFPPTASVGQLMGLLGRSGLVISNDSASLHLGVGLGRPVVGVFGPTDPRRVGPYGHDDAVVQPDAAREPGFTFDYRKHRDDQSLIAQIPVATVWSMILRVAGTSPDRQTSKAV
ncbi:glycosyltransferase family 9 protein [Mucisphaera calidilacus]|uniref:Lipopolysaccharide heptosyltransferase 1 n=1 Tax=Mucisphaera calidilacus TaxID=2527982 RepID=A0A518C0C2_9BACT|nr:glycosyltransferase family 9 protein [Mucisphaera calidilacus]QDU72670.1 Lipopolysaccharide heptosyltransferase 1 [Mucisphaera calidilacus]